MAFSVLMSLYEKERPEFLRESLDSVFAQTLQADEVILVEDGPLTVDLYGIIDEYSSKHPELKAIKCKTNQGLGRALAEGLKHCTNDLVIRMDTDDICKPNRFERQIQFMNKNPELSASGTWIDEFISSPNNVVSQRITVESPEDIAKFARSRNPLNHPSVIFRKSAVESVGGYCHFPLFEDWYLWIRLIHAGHKLANLPEALLWFRTSPDMFKRRGGWKYAKDSAHFQFTLRKLGFISTLTAMKNSIIRGCVYILPNTVRGWIYNKFLRK